MRDQGQDSSRSLGPAHAGTTAVDDALLIEQNVQRLWMMLRVAWAERWIVIAALVLAVGGWLLHESLWGEPARYRSTSRLYVRQSQPELFVDGLGIGASPSASLTQATVLTSESVLGEALKNPSVAELGALRGATDRLAVLRSSLEVTAARADGVIHVSASLRDPTESARLVNAVVEAFIGFHATIRRARAEELRQVLGEEKSRVEAELERQRKALSERVRQGGAGEASEALLAGRAGKVERAASSLTQVRMQLMEARSRHAALAGTKDEEDALREATAALAQAPGSGPPVLVERAALEAARRDQAAASERYGPRSPVLGDLRRRVEELTVRAHDERAGVIRRAADVLRQQVDTLERQEADLRAALAQAERESAETQAAAGDVELLRKSLERAERVHEAVVDRIERLDLADAAPEMLIAVLDRATPATNPLPRAGRKRLALALMAGLALAGVGVLLRGATARRLYTAEQVAAEADAPVVAVVPRIAGKLTDEQRGRYIATHPLSEPAEACRALRTALLFGAGHRPSFTLTVTSPTPGVGKSTVAANLAIALAAAGRRTLLLDADFRHPRHHRIFGVAPTTTLASLLRAEGPARLDDTLCPTDIPGLDVLACTEPAADPGELLTSRAFANVLAHLRERYDVVVIDAVPVLSVSDARVGAALSDLTMLVVAPRMSARTVRHARRALDAVGAELFGVVVNGAGRWDMATDGYAVAAIDRQHSTNRVAA